MLNVDVADLFEQAPVGARVVVLGPPRAVARFENDLSRAFNSIFRPLSEQKKRLMSGWRRMLPSRR
jgi:hypothetical protein